jgi:pimeloyl-ACP methyl ester carboxylesterase
VDLSEVAAAIRKYPGEKIEQKLVDAKVPVALSRTIPEAENAHGIHGRETEVVQRPGHRLDAREGMLFRDTEKRPSMFSRMLAIAESRLIRSASASRRSLRHT